MSLGDRLGEVRVLSATQSGYPSRLRDLKRPPVQLRVLGDFSAEAKSVAIVGTRRADPEACEFARRLAAECVFAGRVVVSGGALGIDYAAHLGALEAGGVTWVVLPTGFARAYPLRHRGFYEQILNAGGALLTETDEDAQPQRGRFLTRNRLIAALADVVVVVQAPGRSGSLSTARNARDLGRKLYAVPTAPWDLRGSGLKELLHYGAAICIQAQDILSLGPSISARSGTTSLESPNQIEQLREFSEVEEQLLSRLSGRPRHPDELADLTGIDLGMLQRTILKLEIEGVVQLRPGGRYSLSPEPARPR